MSNTDKSLTLSDRAPALADCAPARLAKASLDDGRLEPAALKPSRLVGGAAAPAARPLPSTRQLVEQAGQLEIPFLWIEKAIERRLLTCLQVIDQVPLRLDTHPAWLKAREAVLDAHSAIVELRRAAYQMLGLNDTTAICHMKYRREPWRYD
jgi:hypothetical protein